ncbi:MAG: serine hydrolase domain-containing protein [Candidatus Hodarchaeales archaeon]|jgi:CubicO group peptidase (beta-lactamase class C family)
MKNKFWPSNSREWTEVAPEEQGLDSGKIAEMFEFIEKNSYNIHSVIIARNGYLLTEEYLYKSKLLDTKAYSDLYPPKTYTGPNHIFHDQASATKSLTSILIGIALKEGFLNNLSQKLYEFFADIWDPNFCDSESKKNITIEQLLSMNSGLIGGWEPNYPKTKYPPDDCIKLALNDVPLGATPGEAGNWVYSNEGPNLLSGIITNATSKSTEEFAKEYLFNPLGIAEDETFWPHDDKNINYGAYAFHCSPKVQAKLGILCLNNGTWNGKQIVDKEYIGDATTAKISLVKGETSMDYGYLFFMMDKPLEGYYMAGSGGQMIYVMPKYNITVGFTAGGIIPKEGYNKLLLDYIAPLDR